MGSIFRYTVKLPSECSVFYNPFTEVKTKMFSMTDILIDFKIHTDLKRRKVFASLAKKYIIWLRQPFMNTVDVKKRETLARFIFSRY